MLAWVTNNLETHAFVCQNGVVPLFGDRPDQWSRANLITFVLAMFEPYKIGT